jgi:hypothetical protein
VLDLYLRPRFGRYALVAVALDLGDGGLANIGRQRHMRKVLPCDYAGGVPRRYDARRVLQGLVGKEIRTLTGRPNTVLAVERDTVRVATRRSPAGQAVPIKWVQDALDRLAAEGEVEISVASVGYRSAFIGAVLGALDGTEASPSTMRVKRIDG